MRYVSIEQRNFEEEAGGVVTLLQEMKNERLAGDLFVDLLSEFMSAKPSSSDCIVYFLFSTTFLYILHIFLRKRTCGQMQKKKIMSDILCY